MSTPVIILNNSLGPGSIRLWLDLAPGLLSDADASDCCRFHLQCTAIDLRDRTADRWHLDCRPGRLWQSGSDHRLVLYSWADCRAFPARDEGKTAARSRLTVAATGRRASASYGVTGATLNRGSSGRPYMWVMDRRTRTEQISSAAPQ